MGVVRVVVVLVVLSVGLCLLTVDVNAKKVELEPKNDDEVAKFQQNFEIKMNIPEHIQQILMNRSRLEDCAWNSDQTQILIPSHSSDLFAILDIQVKGKQVNVTDIALYSSSTLKGPHGAVFIDDSTVAIAARESNKIFVFKIPKIHQTGSEVNDLNPASSAPVHYAQGVVATSADTDYELLVSHPHAIKSLIFSTPSHILEEEAVLFDSCVHAPDALAVSNDRELIVVTNHDSHNTAIYPNLRGRGRIIPTAFLRGPVFPHGVVITSDNRFVLVADASSPYVHIFMSNTGVWRGSYNPVGMIQVMTDEEVKSCRVNEESGGVKGLSLNKDNTILMVTAECGIVRMFAVARILKLIQRYPSCEARVFTNRKQKFTGGEVAEAQLKLEYQVYFHKQRRSNQREMLSYPTKDLV